MKRKLAFLTAAIIGLSAVPTLSADAAPSAEMFRWIPTSFETARDFCLVEHGATYIDGQTVCAVFREPYAESRDYSVSVDGNSKPTEIYHETFNPPAGYEGELLYTYEVVVYHAENGGQFDISLNLDSQTVQEYSFQSQFTMDSAKMIETDYFSWVPDCYSEYTDFIETNGNTKVKDKYICFCDDVNYSTGADIVMEQSGTAEIKQIKDSGVSKSDQVLPPGSTAHSVRLYEAVTPGTVDVTIYKGRMWDPNAPKEEMLSETYKVNNNLTITKIDSKNIMTVSVVDYDTGELILTSNDEEWAITLEAGCEVEYALTDGTFAWGTQWMDLGTWSYGQLNPRKIDVSQLCSGFGINAYRAKDMYIPDGYFLPEDYLEIKYRDSDKYHTDIAEGITIKLKKSLKGDINADGNFTVADVVTLQKWILAVPDAKLADRKAADLCEDGRLNVLDLCMMKRELINSVSESNRNIYSEKRIDMIGYSDELWEIANSDKSSAIVTSTEELRTYLSQITEKRVIDPMLDKYNDSFFNNNVLLVKSIYQSCGGDNMYQIDSVQYEGDSLVVNYSDNYELKPYIDVVNGLLAQAVIPKKNYHADSVEWRFTSYLDTPVLFIDDYMISESPNGWKGEAYERVITAGGSRYSRPLCNCDFLSWEDHINHIKSEGGKEEYIDLIKDYDVLEMISDFSKNASKYKNCKMKSMGFSVADLGEMKLSVLYKDENGNMQSLELYRFGGECAWLDNAEVQEFIKMLIERDYIPDKHIFDVMNSAPKLS